MTDFSVPRRMSAGAFLILFLKNSKTIMGVVMIWVIAKLINTETELSAGDVWLRLLVSCLAIAGITFLLTAAAYFPKKFYVKDGNLVFTHGLLQREKTIIPLDRIHSLRTNKGLLYQMFQMRGMAIDTLASKGEELELILSEADWRDLMLRIAVEETSTAPQEASPSISPAVSMRFSNANLLRDAFCQNHLKGAAILFGFLSMALDHISDFYQDAVDRLTDLTVTIVQSSAVTTVSICILILIAYLTVLTLWLGKVILRYFDLKLSYSKSMLTFDYGLIARFSSRFSFDKICTIWVKRNWLEKRFGLATIMLRQALNVSANKEEDNLKIYNADRSSFFLKWWLGENYTDSPVIACGKSGKGVFFHSFTGGALTAIATAAVLYSLQLYAWILIPAVYLLFAFPNSIMAMRRSRIMLRESHVRIDSGGFAEIRNYLRYSNIEVVRITRTPFTPLFHRVTLAISTSGTTFRIRSLKQDEATRIYEILLQRNESQLN